MDLNNVLLIEDNPADARLAIEYLRERFGDECSVRHAPTLAAGISELQQHEVDVVLLDLGLPDSDGLASYLAIRDKAPTTPVVILTGDANADKALQALHIGAEDYLAKQQADSVTLVRAMRNAVQRKQITEQLRHSEARYKTLVEIAEEGVVQLSRAGDIRGLNRRAAVMLGVADHGVMRAGTPGRRLQDSIAPADRVCIRLLLRTPVGQRCSCELQLQRDDLPPCQVIAAAGAIEPREGEDADVVLLLTDVTDRKLAEEELAELKNVLEAHVAERTQTLQSANVDLQAANQALAHDLRTPLHGIIGLAGLIRSDPGQGLTESTKRRLQLVEKTALDMNELISGLLSLGSLGRQPLDRQTLDMSALFETIAQHLFERAPDRQVALRVQPHIHASGDRVLVTNVLRNLLHNAWKFACRVPLTVIEFAAEPDAGEGQVFSVSDNGVGFDPRESAALFEPYQRLSSARGIEGHGLGLASARRIVERHGGRIWATSDPGVRTTFFFTLGPAGERGASVA